MTLINTDGMAFIGPGSEWFWTALTGIVLAVTFIAIARQLRLQAHASAVEQIGAFQREAKSEQHLRYELEVLIGLRDGTDPADVPESAAYPLAQYWEAFATLARLGHLDMKLMWEFDPWTAQKVWGWLAPWARKRRAELGAPDWAEQLEWLAGVMAEMDGRGGRQPVTPADITRDFDREIAYRQERIRTMEATRTVTLAQPVAVTVIRQARAK
jgi:hypothetical protein